MGKTVKSRTFFSILSFLIVVVFCMVAKGSVPKLYESYKQKEIAQQAATQTTKAVEKKDGSDQQQQQQPSIPAEEPSSETPDEDSNVYEVPDEPAEDEEPIEEDSSEDDFDADFDFDFDTGDDSDSEEDNDGGFISAIIDFFGSLFEKLSNCKLLVFFKDIFAKILGVFGITM